MTLTPLRYRLASTLFAVVAVSAAPRVARADLCFPTPVALPGLSGAPAWKGAGVVRSELNEPRWAAAPGTWFASDPTGTGGLYRVLVDAAYTELSVSFQAPVDLGSETSADKVYFAFTTDGMTAALAKGLSISVNNSGVADPADAMLIQEYDYNGSSWAAPLAPPPSWLLTPSVWRNNVQHDAAWGINFKVNLAAAGLSPSTPFKILFALHKEDELNTANNVSLFSIPSGAALVPDTLFVADPTKWATAAAVNAGCEGGITLSSDQIGSRNTVASIPAPTVIDTTNGAVNHLYVTPSIPESLALSLSPGQFQASFHLANWSAIAATNAPWAPLQNGTAVGNGISPAPNELTIEFACPPNTATTTCGIPTPTEAKQSIYVELKPAPENAVPFTTAAAYVNMEFKCLGCPATGGTGGAAGGGTGGTGGTDTNSGGTNSGATNGGSAPNAGASGALDNAAGEAGSDAISSAGGAIFGGGAASAGRSTSDSGASAVNAGNGGTTASASSSSDKSGCNCALLAAPTDHGYGPVTLLALSAAIARRRRRRA